VTAGPGDGPGRRAARAYARRTVGSGAVTRGEWLDAEQQAAWRAWLEGSALLDDALGRDLVDVGLTFSEYDILVQLSERRTAACG
jgi:hypothetical protein